MNSCKNFRFLQNQKLLILFLHFMNEDKKNYIHMKAHEGGGNIYTGRNNKRSMNQPHHI